MNWERVSVKSWTWLNLSFQRIVKFDLKMVDTGAKIAINISEFFTSDIQLE